MIRWMGFTGPLLGLFLVVSSCDAENVEADHATALEALAGSMGKSASEDRLVAVEQRLDRMEARFTRLEELIRTAAASASAAKELESVGESAPVAESSSTDGQEAGRLEPPVESPFELTLGAPPAGAEITVVLWHSYRGKEKEALLEALAEFQARYPTIRVDAQDVPFSALRDKIVVTVPRGNGPDLFVYAHNVIGDWVMKGGILAPLGTLIEKYDSFEGLSRFLPDTVKALAYQGEIYGLPLAFKSHALFYNKKLIKTPPKTVDELIAMAKAVEGGEGEQEVHGLVYDAGLFYNHALWAQGFGAVVMDEQGVPNLTSQAMVDSLKLVRGFSQSSQILPPLDDNMATFLFNSGLAAFVIKGAWFLGEIDEGVDYGVAVLPEVAPGLPARPFLGSEGVFLSQSSQQKEAAFQVMRYLVSRECAAVRYVKGRQLVANVSVYEDTELTSKADPTLEVFRRQAETTVVMSSRPEMQVLWTPANNALKKVIFGDAEPGAALQDAQEKVEKDITMMGKQ